MAEGQVPSATPSRAFASHGILRREVYDPGAAGPRIALVTAYERFSVRADVAVPRSAALRSVLADVGGAT